MQLRAAATISQTTASALLSCSLLPNSLRLISSILAIRRGCGPPF
jgi:hypothetical protein